MSIEYSLHLYCCRHLGFETNGGHNYHAKLFMNSLQNMGSIRFLYIYIFSNCVRNPLDRSDSVETNYMLESEWLITVYSVFRTSISPLKFSSHIGIDFSLTIQDLSLSKTLRIYPTFINIIRTCVKDYQIPGTDKIIEKGYQVFISMYAMHISENYYEEPHKFKPERFNEENSARKNQINRPFYPFGGGPRSCIGVRKGKLMTKASVVMILQNFHVELDDKLTGRPFEFDPEYLGISLLGGLYF